MRYVISYNRQWVLVCEIMGKFIHTEISIIVIYFNNHLLTLKTKFKIMNDLLKIWVKKVSTNDANKVAELYHDEGLLLGTFSKIERHGKELILDYFENLLTSKVDVEIVTQNIHKTDSYYVNSGFYNFILKNKIIKARFSFVFIKTRESWKIISHHSSVLPEDI